MRIRIIDPVRRRYLTDRPNYVANKVSNFCSNFYGNSINPIIGKCLSFGKKKHFSLPNYKT